MTQQDLSNLANEVSQLESERDRIDDRIARIGVALMEAYPADSRPDLVSTLLDEIDNLLQRFSGTTAISDAIRPFINKG